MDAVDRQRVLDLTQQFLATHDPEEAERISSEVMRIVGVLNQQSGIRIMLTLANDSATDKTVYLEPLGESVELPPGVNVVVPATILDPNVSFTLSMENDSLTVWCEAGTTIESFEKRLD